MITLKNIHRATAQQVFEQVANHLLAQNARCMDPNDTDVCLYRFGPSLKCAAGCLIADDEYRDDFEMTNWDDVWNKFSDDAPNPHSCLITALQILHDRKPVENWRAELIKEGTERGLDVGFLQKIRKIHLILYQ